MSDSWEADARRTLARSPCGARSLRGAEKVQSTVNGVEGIRVPE